MEIPLKSNLSRRVEENDLKLTDNEIAAGL